jgi:hypothetical protein
MFYVAKKMTFPPKEKGAPLSQSAPPPRPITNVLEASMTQLDFAHFAGACELTGKGNSLLSERGCNPAAPIDLAG